MSPLKVINEKNSMFGEGKSERVRVRTGEREKENW